MDTAQRGYDESKALIGRWRGRGRLDYAVTPRFAVTSSEEQLEAAGALAREFPGSYVQTHLDENEAEIKLVAERFPRRGAISTSMIAPGCSDRDLCSAIASIWRTMKSPRSRRAVRSPPFARRRTCFLARASSIRRGSTGPACGSRSPQTSAAARATRCCAPPRRGTRSSSSTGNPGRPRTPSTA